jgi:hypothetical protein
MTGREEQAMGRTNSDATTVIPVLREDGTVYFQYTGKSINERLCQWGVAILWFLVLAVLVGALLWI